MLNSRVNSNRSHRLHAPHEPGNESINDGRTFHRSGVLCPVSAYDSIMEDQPPSTKLLGYRYKSLRWVQRMASVASARSQCLVGHARVNEAIYPVIRATRTTERRRS